MNIPIAIKILEEDIKEDKYFLPIEFIEASKLGIEALKHEVRLRKDLYRYEYTLLPGETEE